MNTSVIIHLLSTYHVPAIFLGSFLFGETVVLAAAFLAAQGLWSAWTVFLVSLAGAIVSDILWFLFGQKIFALFHRFEAYRTHHERFLAFLERKTGARPERALIFLKPVYGTRILTIIYLSLQKVPFRTFFVYNAIGSAAWLAIITLFGWLAGKSIVDLVPWVEKLEYAALSIVCIAVAWRILFSWISKKTMAAMEEKE